MASGTTGERVHGLDALRVAAMLLVIVLHAAIPYMDLPLPGLPWPGGDPTSAALSHLYWSFRGPSMAVFFVLAGFFAAQLMTTRGAAAFVRQRAARLLVPFLAATVVVLPVTFCVCAAGWWLAGDCTWDDIRRVKFGSHIQPELYGPGHLWFLEDLVVFCAIYWAVRTLWPRRSAFGERRYDRLLVSPWRALWLAIPTALVVGVDPTVFTVHHNTFVPTPSSLLHYGVFFAAGTWLHRRRDVLDRLTRRGSVCELVCALPLFIAVESLVRARAVGPAAAADDIALAAALALFIWLTVFGFFGLFLTTFTRPRPFVRHLADASYWAYLVHLPVVVGWQVVLTAAPIPAVLKWLVAAAATIPLCLWSYGRWVRGGALGALLNGDQREPGRNRRHERTRSSPTAAGAGWRSPPSPAWRQRRRDGAPADAAAR